MDRVKIVIKFGNWNLVLAMRAVRQVISVIIPTLNEDEHLPKMLQALGQNACAHEVIVADGGSIDGTVRIAREAGATVVNCTQPGRAEQMNAGGRVSRAEIFLFLHADTLVRSSHLRQIEVALNNPGIVGGGFARQFLSSSIFLKMTCALATCRSRALGWFFGDQGIFVRRQVFESLGGFKKMKVFEDLDFSRRLSRRGKVVTLCPGVVSSARRFAGRGPLRTTWSDFWLTCDYLAHSREQENSTIPDAARAYDQHK